MSRARLFVSEWLDSVLPMASAFEQRDVDQLGENEDWSRPDVMSWPMELFEALNTEIRSRDLDASALLAVPLEYSDKLEPAEPDVARALSTAWTQTEVPGLYLLRDPSFSLRWDGEEEYRCVLKSTAVADVTMAYYRCWRTAPSEFARALYFLRGSDAAGFELTTRE